MEQDGLIAPFTLTVGVYGYMAHTVFCRTHDEAMQRQQQLMRLIEELSRLLQTLEDEQTAEWQEKRQSIVDAICAL